MIGAEMSALFRISKARRHSSVNSKGALLAPTNITSDDARKRQFGVVVFHVILVFLKLFLLLLKLI
jgi:hypothetical protein